jgi:hypothetical protein
VESILAFVSLHLSVVCPILHLGLEL